LDEVGDVVFPRSCLHCQALVEPPTDDGIALRHLCRRCASLIEVVRPPHCRTCGHPFFGELAGERMCPHCEGLDSEFGEGRTAVLFKGPARTLVIEFKYHGGLHVLEDLAALFRRAPELLEHVRGAVLVPVPLHPRKARERGYNQAELLAGALAQSAGGGTTVEALLRRQVDTRSQTAFDRESRLANLKNAFALAPGAFLTPGQHYILVDDVFTTGSTLNRCAHALRRAGVLNLDVVTFGHG
jgi:ComF family protein